MHDNKTKQISRKGAFLKKPSANLERLLEIVNSIPQKVSIAAIHDRNALEIALNGAPDVLRNHVAPRKIESEIDLQEAKKRFSEVKVWREVLFAFQYPIDSNTTLLYDFDQPLALTIQRDENGIVHLRENLLLEVLKEGVDAARVRSCANSKNCQRLFFKGRADQKCCSTACTKQLQTRKWREKLTAEQKEEQKRINKIKRIERELK